MLHAPAHNVCCSSVQHSRLHARISASTPPSPALTVLLFYIQKTQTLAVTLIAALAERLEVVFSKKARKAGYALGCILHNSGAVRLPGAVHAPPRWPGSC
jgi:hypothetical protein